MSSSNTVDNNQGRLFLSAQRLERLLLVVALLGLIITGLPQKYALSPVSGIVFTVLGGIESTRILHRFFASILAVELIFHIVRLAYQWFVMKISPKIWLSGSEWRAFFGLATRNNLSNSERQLPLKVEYLFLVVSIIILAITGAILLNPILISDILPGTIIPIARSIHSDQALLLAVVLLIWRFGIFFLWKPQRDTVEISDSLANQNPQQFASRRSRFFVLAGISVLVVGWAIIRYATYETTALDTIERHAVPVYAPGFMPESGDPAVGEVVWLSQRCSFCHGEDASGGLEGLAPALPTEDLTFEAFVIQVRQGDKDMPSYTSGELPDSYLVHLWAWLTQK